MNKFLQPLRLECLDSFTNGRRNWLLLTGFGFSSVVLERVIIAPEGFITDFASTPKVLWPVLSPTGPYGKAAVIHDFLYRTVGYPRTKLQADQVFMEAMVELGVGWFTRQIVYRGVRIGGGRSFKQ